MEPVRYLGHHEKTKMYKLWGNNNNSSNNKFHASSEVVPIERGTFLLTPKQDLLSAFKIQRVAPIQVVYGL